jgi:hypothetical protein
MDKMDEYVRTVRLMKKDHVKRIAAVLRDDPRSDVSDCKYYAGDEAEIVTIEYYGGHIEYINVSLNSLGSIHEEIIKQVYHHNAVGLITDEKRVNNLLQTMKTI